MIYPKLSDSCILTFSESLKVRLINGESKTEGLVQVNYFGSWLHVCGDHGWDVRDARVICHQLGFGEAVLGYTPMEEGPSGYYDELIEVDRTRPIVTIDRMRCHGNETNVGQCKYEVQFSQTCRYGAPLTCHTPRPGKKLRYFLIFLSANTSSKCHFYECHLFIFN